MTDYLGIGAKPDERELWAAVLAGEWPRDAGARLGIPPNRVAYLCERWSKRRIYCSGVSIDMGWQEVQPRDSRAVTWTTMAEAEADLLAIARAALAAALDKPC